MTTITKRELVVRISEKTGLKQVAVLAVVQQFMDEVTAILAENNEVALRKFGSFHVKTTKPKVGRNPNKPAAAVPIPARAIVKFKPGKELKEQVAKLLPEKKEKVTGVQPSIRARTKRAMVSGPSAGSTASENRRRARRSSGN
jgi:nucleoid DNA-binding protein